MSAYAGMTQTAILEKTDSPLRGVYWMLVTGLCFVAVTVSVKVLDGRLPAAESAFLRYILGIVFLIPMLGALIQSKLTKRQVSLFGLRGLVHAMGVILWFYALARIPIAEVTAMNYMAPIYVTLGAVFVLGERLAIRRILAICVAFLGALIILRPGFRELDTGHFAMIGAAIAFAIGYLIAKKMSDEVSAVVVVGMLSLMVPIGLAPIALLNWVVPTLWELAILMGVACFATAGHFTMTKAFQAAPVSVTMPVQFLQLVWSILLGVVFFAEPADVFVILGGLLIVSAISFISWREAMLKRA